jgi:hypothetical protein
MSPKNYTMLQKLTILLVLLLPRYVLSNGESQSIAAQILPGDISFGLIKKELIVGKSTQEDVIRRFGSPNNMVLTSGGRGEMWIYDRIRSESSVYTNSSDKNLGFGVGRSSTGIVAGTRSSTGSSSSTTSVRTLTVILDFDSNSVLKDISARQGGY